MKFKKNKLGLTIMGIMGTAMMGISSISFAGNGNGNQDPSYTLQGTCAFLPADRATEFHGNPGTSKLNLGMAGNQWVVFEKAMQEFGVYIGTGDGTEPAFRENDATGWTLDALNQTANEIYVQLIPPGQIRKQIKSGCMILGNDEDRNFLPGNVQVDFDVFASTNYNLMQDLANNGFIDEAVPYIKNRLDLMVAVGNPQGIGNTNRTGDAEFDAQFDIIMDLLSGDTIASSLDHINEGIHNASNNYMKAAHNWVKANDRNVTLGSYTFADGTTDSGEKMASEWIQLALAKVATPMAGSPGAERLISRDAGENHSSHALVDNGCGTAGDLLFCEYAILNKANTHESRVHHVETPGGIQNEAGFEPVDVGYVWITELAYQLNNGNLNVQGMVGDQDISNLGIPRPAGSNVNNDITYSLALLATAKHKNRGRQFIDFLRSPQGQLVYTNGGFTGLSAAELNGGNCYSQPVSGVSTATPRNGDGSCDDWLANDE